MYLDLLQNGYAITLYGKGYTATTFYYDNNCIYYNNDEIGYKCKHDVFTQDKKFFDLHINNMLNAYMCVEIVKR